MQPHSSRLPVSAGTFAIVFINDTARAHPVAGAPDCPVAIAAGCTDKHTRKCDCSNELRIFALAAESGHPCGEGGKCPVRTYLETL